MFRTSLINLYKNSRYPSSVSIFQANLHTSCKNYLPRLGASNRHENEEPATESNEKRPNKQEELKAWNEVEREMFHQKKSPHLKVPISDFKQLRHERDSQLFDMKKINRESMRESQKPFKKKLKKISQLTPPEVVQDPDIGEYLKLERDDPLLDDIFLTVNSKKQQERKHSLVLEGRRLIQDALKVGLKMNFLIFSKLEQVKLLKEELSQLETKAKLLKVANHNLKFWSQLTTTPGLMGIFERPLDMNSMIERTRAQPLPLSVICDNIREPNNLGAIIRVAAAAGVDQVILTKGCTSPWDMKALRGSAGTAFRVKIIGPVEWEQVASFFPWGVELFIADNKLFPNNSTGYDKIELKSKVDTPKAIIIGGESHGISSEARNLMLQNLRSGPGGGVINIPLMNEVESLNVASAVAILLFEMRRKLTEADPSLLVEE